MQIDKTTSISGPVSEVSRQNAAAPAHSRINVRHTQFQEGDERDTVHTSQKDLVLMVLQERDRKAEARVTELREQFESGSYNTNPHEVARAILEGVLAGY